MRLDVIELCEGSQKESSGQMEFMLKKVGRSAGVSGSFDLVTGLV